MLFGLLPLCEGGHVLASGLVALCFGLGVGFSPVDIQWFVPWGLAVCAVDACRGVCAFVGGVRSGVESCYCVVARDGLCAVHQPHAFEVDLVVFGVYRAVRGTGVLLFHLY